MHSNLWQTYFDTLARKALENFFLLLIKHKPILSRLGLVVFGADSSFRNENLNLLVRIKFLYLFYI